MMKYPSQATNVLSGNQTSTNQRCAPSLPVEQLISKMAQDETGKRQYYRPIYSLHKWWARRPGTLFRAIILMSTHPDLRETLLKKNSAGSVDSKSPYFDSYNLSEVVILDPFIGGGTTLVEANRLGAKVIGCDINPVAYWVTRENLKVIDIDKLDAHFEHIAKTAGERIKAMYKTRCAKCCSNAETLYAFWIRMIPCLHCRQPISLYKRCLLNEGASRNRMLSLTNPATVFCPHCLNLFQWGGEQFATCPACQTCFDPYSGTYDKGSYQCACRANKISLLETIRQGAQLTEYLVAIEYWCPLCKKRLYKSPDEDDKTLANTLAQRFFEKEAGLILPDQQIPLGTSSRRWIQHGYTRFRDVFNVRQLLAFNEIIDSINEIECAEYRHCFYTILSNMLEYNNMMTPYNYPHRKLHHLFNYHAMPLTTMPVENNLWGVNDEGAGTFVNCYKRYLNAKIYCAKPYEKFKDSSGQVITIMVEREHIGAHFVQSYDELLQSERAALLLNHDSSHIPELPNGSVDFVITDPPYYDNVHYSELSNFFYAWLSKLVTSPYFENELVPTEREAVVNKGQGKGEEDYTNLLSAVFRECHRTLKDTGKLIFTFHHTNPRAWWTIFQSIQQSGFRLVDSFPVHTEYRVNPHIRNKQALDMDLVLVCQKQCAPFRELSGIPADALERAFQIVGQYQNGSRNFLYLHFVSELLRSANCSASNDIPSYEWFASAIEMFDTLVLPSETNGHPSDKVQLALFEEQENYNKE